MNTQTLNPHRITSGPYGSSNDEGFNGMFVLTINGLSVRIIASDGAGWQHVSVSLVQSNLPPSWAIMCKVKDLFWEKDDWVVQFHPPESEYVNNHPGCLHLWKCTDGRVTPTPDSILVGIK